MPRTVAITGANRGVGLAVAKVYLAEGATVLATCRRPQQANDLQRLRTDHPERIFLFQLDVDSEESVRAAAEEIAGRFTALDVLINNAGIFPEPASTTLAELDFREFHKGMETNAVGPLRVTRAFLGLLRKGEHPRVVNISSGSGCISRKSDGGMYAYGASKAALNYLTRTMANELKAEGIIVVAQSPGWVRTDMGGQEAPLDSETSARGIVRTTNALTMEDTSSWFSWDGQRRTEW